MKTSKTFLLLALAAAALAAEPARAQNTATNAPAGGAVTNAAPRARFQGSTVDRLAVMLNLTDAQKGQMRPILDAQRQQIGAIYRDMSLSRDDKRAKIRAIHEATAKQLQAFLTPEQYQKWQTLSQPRMRRVMPPPASANTNAPAAP